MAAEPAATTAATKSSNSGWFLRLINIIIQLAILGVLVWVGILLRLIYEGMGLSGTLDTGLLVYIGGTPTVEVTGGVYVTNTPTVRDRVLVMMDGNVGERMYVEVFVLLVLDAAQSRRQIE
ncbi:hypothetical protein BDD12DRAFT_887265 [Trichophaea hybrida]|nr:hypothetical protein BDD12DRAFT_887265 [Trichophaea hybrida]